MTNATHESRQAPYFFLSYARESNKTDAGTDELVGSFFRELSQAVASLTGHSSLAPLGFLDEPVERGANWEKEITDALTRCRVFVPLYSVQYFASDFCGKEWYAFQQRQDEYASRTGTAPTAIVPVLWSPVPYAQLPPVARALQFDHYQRGPLDAMGGFAELAKTGSTTEFRRAISGLAKRIVGAAEHTAIPPGRDVDFQALPSAFSAPHRHPGTRTGVSPEPSALSPPASVAQLAGLMTRLRGYSPTDVAAAATDLNREIAELFLRIGSPPQTLVRPGQQSGGRSDA